MGKKLHPGSYTEPSLHYLPSRETLVTQINLLVSPLGAIEDDAGRGVFNGVEWFFTGGHHGRTFECMFTHFAIELVFANGIVNAKLERTHDGVKLSERGYMHREYVTWSGVPEHPIDWDVAERFCNKESKIPYSFATKNCKHFTYDFFSEIVHRQSQGDFGNWCRPYEDRWKELTW